MKQIIQKSYLWLSISGVFIAASIISLVLWQLNFGIDFTGGSLMEVRFSQNQPTADQVREVFSSAGLTGEITIQSTESQGYIARFQDTSEEMHQKVLTALKATYKNEAGEPVVSEARYESIGASIGQEMRSKALTSIVFVLIFIMIYVAWAFRKVSYPVKSWKYGVAAIIALFHDITITLGIFAILGRFFNVEVGLPFVAALLTILGYSVNDTIVVFDRIRENLTKLGRIPFTEIVNRSLNETIARSVNTSLTVLLSLLAIYLFGGESIKYFALALMCGIFFGTYSSIFIASPVLVLWQEWSQRRGK